MISGSCFVLRPLRKGDEASVCEHINDKAIARLTLAIPYPYMKKDASAWILHTQSKKFRSDSFHFAIDMDGKVVGGIGLSSIKEGRAEIGYWLGKKFWGKGIVTEAIKHVCKYGRKTYGLVRISARTYPENMASMRVLEKNGFVYEGRQRKAVLKNGKHRSIFLFGKVY